MFLFWGDGKVSLLTLGEFLLTLTFAKKPWRHGKNLMSKPPTIDRKSLNKPDEFVKQGRHALELIAGHQKKILVVAGAVIVVAFSFYFYDMYQTSQNEAGWRKYAEVSKLPEAQQWDKLKTLSEEYRSAVVGQFAALNLADHYFEEAKKELEKNPKMTSVNAPLAVEYYSKALSFSKLSPNEKGLLLVNRGQAFEIAQKWEDALTDYSDAVKIGFEGKPLALLGEARIYEVKKEHSKAAETYEKISADFLNTEYGRLAKGYLRRLKSPLFSESKS